MGWGFYGIFEAHRASSSVTSHERWKFAGSEALMVLKASDRGVI